MTVHKICWKHLTWLKHAVKLWQSLEHLAGWMLSAWQLSAHYFNKVKQLSTIGPYLFGSLLTIVPPSHWSPSQWPLLIGLHCTPGYQVLIGSHPIRPPIQCTPDHTVLVGLPPQRSPNITPVPRSHWSSHWSPRGYTVFIGRTIKWWTGFLHYLTTASLRRWN